LSLALSAPAAAQPTEVDETRLAALIARHGLALPERFKALVGELHLDPEGGPPTAQWFDFEGTSDDRDDWWPASSIKLYAAVAALEQSHGLGFSPRARVMYHYDGEEPVRMRLRDVVHRAIVQSNNQAFNQLVELVGFDTLNRRFFSRRNGFVDTVFLRAYSARIRDPETGHGVNRYSPRITIEQGRRTRELAAREGTGRFECPDQGNCTTLRELAESMRRVMLHEHLPPSERYRLGDEELALLREVLGAERREHGELLVAAVREGFGEDVPLRIYHKPGYAYRWTSDILFVHRTDTDQRFIIAAAAWADRRVLDAPLRCIGALLGSGRLTGRAVASAGSEP
jgi:beta-lactamase class A